MYGGTSKWVIMQNDGSGWNLALRYVWPNLVHCRNTITSRGSGSSGDSGGDSNSSGSSGYVVSKQQLNTTIG